MTRLFLAISLLTANLSFAQPASISLEGKNNTLNERYHLMKSNSQTFQDYKVIKEFVLDGVWKIVMDSVKKQRLTIVQSHETISQLEANLKSVELTLKKERESAAEVVYGSIHISILGFDFRKSVFLTLLTFVFAGFVIVISFAIGNMNVMRTRMKEKMVIADVVSNEYEEFKRKTLEKQMKLSRELQTERNRIEELMRA
ncbi:MAG: hypothetical protein AABY93_01490 [Bacteroidota bacterium]